MRVPSWPAAAEGGPPPGGVSFFAEGIPFPPELDIGIATAWLLRVAAGFGREVAELTFVLLDDEALLALNVEHLDHDTLTDIITFDLSEGGAIEGECYISLERVRDNAQRLGESAHRELHRVLAHGLLHLCGLGDKSAPEAAVMRAAEEGALDLLPGR